MTRYIILATIFLCVFLSGCADNSETSGDRDGVVVISVWHPWGGTQKEKFERVVAEFNRTHETIEVKSLFTPNDLSNNQKFFTAVAADIPPDAIFVDGQQTAAWAEQGALEPLDDYMERDGVTKELFFDPCWGQNYYRDHAWAVTYCADPNFAFVWNKKVFREVGLDPERPPRTIAELDKYNDIITVKTKGKIERMGIIPWAQFGTANAMFSWGWVFGGDFYDTETGKVTADHPKNIEALEWMVSYSKKFDASQVNAFSSGFGSREQSPFYIGVVAMQFLHISQLAEIKQYAPDLDYGITSIPYPEGGEEKSSWVGGWCLAIPVGSKHPDAAWEFIKWCCASDEGTAAVGKLQDLYPGYRNSPYFEEVRKRPGYAEFLEILEASKHQRPVMPAQAFYMDSLGRSVEYAIYGKMSPADALQKAARETQLELDVRTAGASKDNE